jgi:hypothetical protein
MKQHGQDPDAATIARRIEKALDAAFSDLEQLVNARGSGGSEEVPPDIRNGELLLEIYWRLHDGWNATVAPAVTLIDLTGTTPVWDDVAALCAELERLDQDGGDGDSFPEGWYEDLLARFETRLAKAKAKKAVARKASAKKAAAVVREPPPGAAIRDYSVKSTFEVGQWVRHPKFGVGLVIEVAQHATLEFAGERKVLAHVQAVAAPSGGKSQQAKPAPDSAGLARAAGIDIKRVPPQMDGEK